MTNDDYIKIIENQAAKPTKIKNVQKVLGNHITNSSLFHVNQFGKTFIYKISDPKTSFRNLMLAQALLQNGVLVPDSKVFIGGGTYFERYEIIPGTTLSETLLNESMAPDELENILRDVLTYDKKITEVTPNIKKFSKELILYERRKNHNTQDFGQLLAKLHYVINKKSTTYGNIALHHADLNQSNILLDENKKFKALLDLDSLAICDEYTMLSQIILLWPNISTNKLIEIYESVYNKKLNKRHLKKVIHFRIVKAKIANVLRNIKQK